MGVRPLCATAMRLMAWRAVRCHQEGSSCPSAGGGGCRSASVCLSFVSSDQLLFSSFECSLCTPPGLAGMPGPQGAPALPRPAQRSKSRCSWNSLLSGRLKRLHHLSPEINAHTRGTDFLGEGRLETNWAFVVVNHQRRAGPRAKRSPEYRDPASLTLRGQSHVSPQPSPGV